MRTHKSIQQLVVMLAVVGLAGCASAGGGETSSAEPTGDGIPIEVRNDWSPPTSVMVWVVPETGTRRRLGSVPPNGRRTFNYTPQDETLQLYLLAEPEGPSSGTMGRASEKRSNLFRLVNVQTLSWAVSRQNVTIGG